MRTDSRHPLRQRRDGKKIATNILRDNMLGYLMPAFFGGRLEQQKGTLSLPRRAVGSDRSRYISKGSPRTSADRPRYISIDSECCFRGSQ